MTALSAAAVGRPSCPGNGASDREPAGGRGGGARRPRRRAGPSDPDAVPRAGRARPRGVRLLQRQLAEAGEQGRLRQRPRRLQGRTKPTA